MEYIIEQFTNLGSPYTEFAFGGLFFILTAIIYIMSGYIRYFITKKKFWDPYNE